MKAAAVIIQKYWKGYAQRQRYKKMRVGYMRLQALIRSRVLSHRFRHLRGHIVGLQAHARGYLVRREYGHKMWAIIKIQSHVRGMIAMKRYKKLREDYRKYNEVLRLRRLEEQELKHQGNKRAAEIAEQHYLDRLNEIERRDFEHEMEERRKVEVKKNLISDAARKQDEPVDDSKLVEAMFDFLVGDSSSETPTPHGGRETSVFNDLPVNSDQNEVNIRLMNSHWAVLNHFFFRKSHLCKWYQRMRKTYLNSSSRNLPQHTSKATLPINTQGNH